MYVGHELLGFTLGVLLGRRLDLPTRQRLLLGLSTALFAAVPDIDSVRTVAVAALAAVRRGTLDVFPTTKYVWAHSWVVHRTLTHSLVTGLVAVGLVAGLAVALRRESRRERLTGLAVAAALAAVILAFGYTADGTLGTLIAAVYVGGAALVALLAAGRFDLPTSAVAGGAAAGLLSHPFGDVFIGTPPVFTYPLRTEPAFEKILFSPDPTVHIVLLFGLEVALGWIALGVLTRETGHSLGTSLAPESTLGVGYAFAVGVVHPPDFDVAYSFAIGALATGVAVTTVPALRDLVRSRSDSGSTDTGWIDWLRDPDDIVRLATVALAAVSFALAGYLAAYLLVG